MTYDQIKQQAQQHKGLSFTAAGFRYAFNQPMTGSMKMLNQLIKDGVVTKKGSKYIIK